MYASILLFRNKVNFLC